ncbi:hypothetical protein, partial [Thermolongibacillus altinsuensis]|uniref:hypothetical protein n=1 Tax=Thermolongibacillus altinsuensis TaxID=575256 RepID=UPI00255557F5
TGTGNNTLVLSRLDVLDISDTSNTLRVDGNAGDDVLLKFGEWQATGTTTIASQSYRVYTSGKATLQVDADVAVSVETRLSALTRTNGFRLSGVAANNASGM